VNPPPAGLAPDRTSGIRARCTGLARALGAALVGGSSARLPFEGLPPGRDHIAVGEAALFVCADAASREQLLHALLQNSTRQRIAWVCAPGDTPAGVRPALRAAVQARRLLALAWAPDAAEQLRTLGAEHFLQELGSAGLRPRDLLVLDALDPWLGALPADAALEACLVEAVHALTQLARAHRGPVLFLAPATHRGQRLLPLLAQGRISRIASFQAGAEPARLDIIQWGEARRPAPARPPQAYALKEQSHGGWQCHPCDPAPLAITVMADDRSVVHTTRGVLADADGVPQGWRVHSSTEALLAACRDAVAATVVLAHDHSDAVVELADTVHQLRRGHPHLLRIIVRETDSTLRKNGALALLRLGANAVMERALGFGHLVQLTQDLQAERYAQKPEPDPSRTLQALAPDALHGYLPPRDFCAAVERMLARTADGALEHSLVQLPLLPHVAHIDALLACSPRRDGDIMSADTRGLYLFLYGCAPEDAMAALDALFVIPCSELVQHVQIDPDVSSQLLALAQLRRATETAPTDYSIILRGIAAARRPLAVTSIALPVRSPELARRVHSHVLPLRTASA